MPGIFCFKEIESFLKNVAGGSTGKGAFCLQRKNIFQFAVSPDLMGVHPVEGFDFGGKPGMCRGEERGLLVEIFVAVTHQVSQKASRLVVEIVAGCKDPESLFHGQSVEELPFEQTAKGTDFPSGPLFDFKEIISKDLLE